MYTHNRLYASLSISLLTMCISMLPTVTHNMSSWLNKIEIVIFQLGKKQKLIWGDVKMHKANHLPILYQITIVFGWFVIYN